MIRVLAVLCMCLLCPMSVASADWSGELAISTPIGSPDRPRDDAMVLDAGLVLPEVIGTMTLSTKARWLLSSDVLHRSENELSVDASIPITKGLEAFGRWERRWSINSDWYLAGLRLKFGSN